MLIVVLCVQMHDDHRDGAKEKSEQEDTVMYSRNCLFALHAYILVAYRCYTRI